jgi:hypothetical protein
MLKIYYELTNPKVRMQCKYVVEELSKILGISISEINFEQLNLIQKM